MASSSSSLALFSLLISLNLHRPISSQSNDHNLTVDYDIHDLLPNYGFPKGLLPDNIKSYTISNTGDFIVYLTSPCYVHFPDQTVFYDTKLSGELSYGSVKEAKGISAKEAFFWLPITEMELEPKSGMIVFSVGFVSRTLPASLFEDIPSCSRKVLDSV